MSNPAAPRFTTVSCGDSGFNEVRFVASGAPLHVDQAMKIQENLSWLPGVTDVDIQATNVSLSLSDPTQWLPVALVAGCQLEFLVDPLAAFAN